MNPAASDDSDNGDAGQDPRIGDQPIIVWTDQRAPARSALALVMALGCLVVVLALGFVVLLVTEEGGEQIAEDDAPTNAEGQPPADSESPADDTTAPAPPEDDAERMVVTALANEVGEDYGGVVSAEEARCMAQAVVDVVGIDRVSALAEPGALSEAEEQMLNAAQADCLDPETADRLGL